MLLDLQNLWISHWESQNKKIFFLFAITAQKMKFSIKDFFSNCDQIRRKLRIWSYLLKKSLTENFIFCAVLFCSPTANFGPLSKEQPFSHNGFHGFQIFGGYEIQIFRYTLEVKRGMLYTRHLFYINDVDLDGKTYLNYLTSVLPKNYIPIRINLIFFHAP